METMEGLRAVQHRKPIYLLKQMDSHTSGSFYLIWCTSYSSGPKTLKNRREHVKYQNKVVTPNVRTRFMNSSEV